MMTNFSYACAVVRLPAVKNPPARWRKFLGENPRDQEIERILRSELADAFGRSEELFKDISVKAVFKGVTYESLNDPDFMRIASQKDPVSRHAS
jgi:hypothetical protein